VLAESYIEHRSLKVFTAGKDS